MQPSFALRTSDKTPDNNKQQIPVHFVQISVLDHRYNAFSQSYHSLRLLNNRTSVRLSQAQDDVITRQDTVTIHSPETFNNV